MSRNVPVGVHLTLQVWGEAYTSLLLQHCLPALLSPGNLPALAARFPCRLHVYTTARDEARIRSAALFSELDRLATVAFHRVEWDAVDDKYAALTSCNVRALGEAGAAGAPIVFLAPDTIWADGSLAAVARALEAGRRAVMQTGIRVVAGTALPVMRERFRPDERGVVVVPPRDLVRIALDHMHAYYRGWFWDAERFNRNPAQCYWRVGDEGLVARCFHLHPLMLYPEHPIASFVSTLDDDLPLQAIGRYESIHVVEDSDEVFHVDLADDTWRGGYKELPGGSSAAHLARWALIRTNLYHRRFLTHRIRIHDRACSPAWGAVEAASDVVVRDVGRRLAWHAIGPRARAALFGLTRRRLVEVLLRHRPGTPLVVPDRPWWWRPARRGISWFGADAAARLERARTSAIDAALGALFGINLAARAQGRRPSVRKPSAPRFKRVRRNLRVAGSRIAGAAHRLRRRITRRRRRAIRAAGRSR
ncbi:MAG: hypothetical protein FJW23_02795 [Acidimicrobiia bacterium]|nr:hypothetical protein [Acidimicrobiia bacterium]